MQFNKKNQTAKRQMAPGKYHWLCFPNYCPRLFLVLNFVGFFRGASDTNTPFFPIFFFPHFSIKISTYPLQEEFTSPLKLISKILSAHIVCTFSRGCSKTEILQEGPDPPLRKRVNTSELKLRIFKEIAAIQPC